MENVQETCKVFETTNWKSASSRHELQQTSARLVVQLSQELQQVTANHITDNICQPADDSIFSQELQVAAKHLIGDI